jgi:hypothetical protein
MTIRLTTAGAIALEGTCPSEEAEDLLRHLLDNPGAAVAWESCDYAHTAVIQILLLARPVVQGIPRGTALRDWIYPLLTSRRA